MGRLHPKEYDGYGAIYKTTCIANGKLYIGQTKNSVYDRFHAHLYSAHSDSPKSALARAIKKYGDSQFSYEIMLVAHSPEELDDAEKYLIDAYKTKVPNGYNLVDGGKQSFRVRRLIEVAPHKHFGKHTDDGVDKRTLRRGKKLKISKEGMHARSVSARRSWSELDLHGKTVEERKLDVSIKNGVEVICIETGITYRSAQFAAESIGKNKSCGANIDACCQGRQNTAYGFHWRYKDSQKQALSEYKKANRKSGNYPISVRNLSTNEVFATASDAAKSVGKTYSASSNRIIRAAYDGKLCYGYRWEVVPNDEK